MVSLQREAARRMRAPIAACPRAVTARTAAIAVCVATLCVGCVSWFLAAGAARGATVSRGATAYIDGISDQNMPEWDGAFAGGYFADFFERDWVLDGHIRFARYVVQWNVIAAGPAGSRVKFESWLRDVRELGLIPDVGLTSYDGAYPTSAGDYEARLAEILRRAEELGEPVRYVEAWNEPNNQGHEPPAAAASFANGAQAACASGYGCAVVAGDLEDAPGAGRYAREYERDLRYVPSIWGVHPYRSVQQMSTAPLRELVRDLPGGDAAELWFTEVAARTCTDYGGELRVNGEDGQAGRVRWLLDTLMPFARPAHVFYYTFLLANRRASGCTRGEPEDEALYTPGADLGIPDVARPAAAYASEGVRTPWVFTSAAGSGGLGDGFGGMLAGFGQAAATGW